MSHAPPPEELAGVAIEAWQPCGAAVGVAEDGALAGARVLVPARDPCGQCEVCRRGGAAVCPVASRGREVGAAHVRAAARWLVALDDELALPGPTAAAAAGDVALAYTLYARTGVAPHDAVVIVGATPIARFLVDVLRAKGVTPAVVAPRDAAWCDHLTARGAIVVHDDRDDMRGELARGFATREIHPSRPLRVIATDAAELERAAALAGPYATLTVRADGVATLPGSLLAREVAIVGVAGAHPDLIVEAAALCVRGEVDLAAGVELGAAGARARDRTRAVVYRASM